MKSKLGIVCIILGVMLLSGALFLSLYNMHEETVAQEAVTSIMPQLMEKIEVNKDNKPTDPVTGNKHELELKVPVELLTEEDKRACLAIPVRLVSAMLLLRMADAYHCLRY